ncbi:PilZ domain-containing protein [Qipengyuania aquimaris]|uniref:PilZ domain-containing protein n=1 Tax=Qipengyuania aquimaris TaxID=255984 RepID=UPI001CD25783|nr:PilZ domain-containing protein [Qipengyuania aquimaris]MCA0903636.1 PilZ domain-containing protein [Qipengyuania aquimaris]
MSSIDTRHLNRDSLFLTAEIRLDSANELSRVKVRNLSDGGMMAEGLLMLSRGDRVVVELRNIRPVRGTVAWVQGNRMGIAFEEDIDSKAARAQPVQSESEAPRYARLVGKFAQYGNGLRKI